MKPDVASKSEYLALLSAASVVEAAMGQGNGALQEIGGQSLLSCQIQALRQAGIDSFLIEVDSVPGELLNIADQYRADGVRVEFIRSAKDLQSFLKPGGSLVVQAEGHYFSPSIIAELMQSKAPFISTVDGRDENSAFERIDLNTRWAGFAVLNVETARAMSALPDGWSICSSLLRHAIQCDTSFFPIAQSRLQQGEIVRVETPDDAASIVNRMLIHRSNRPHGFMERYLFGPISRSLAPVIWSNDWAGQGLAASRILFAVGSVGFAVTGWNVTAAALAVMAILSNSMNSVVQALPEKAGRHHWENTLFWVTLVVAAFVTAWVNADYGSDPVAFVAISIGLALLSRKLALPQWAAGLMLSPALLATAFLAASAFSAIETGVKLIALLQMATILVGLYQPKFSGKNAEHA